MFIVKCLPIVGTAVNAVEAVAALADGDGKKCVAKLAQTGVGAAMDTAFIMSGGLSSFMTAPLTGGTIEGGKIVSKKLMSEMIVKEAGKITTNVAIRAVTQYATDKAYESNGGQRTSDRGWNGKPVQFLVIEKGLEAVEALSEGDGNKFGFKMSQVATVVVESFTKKSSQNSKKGGSGGSGNQNSGIHYSSSHSTGTGSGNDPPRQNPKLPKEHYDTEMEVSPDNPITYVLLGRNGRVEKLKATIRKRHLRPRPPPKKPNEKRRKKKKTYTPRIKRFVDSLGRVNIYVVGFREIDEVGHLVGDLLGGPRNATYNFIPQSPLCNMQYYNRVESNIYEYLEQRAQDDYVMLSVEMVYIDDFKGLSPDRPTMLKVHLTFSNGEESTFELSNM